MTNPDNRIAECVDDYLKNASAHFGRYDPLLFLLSFARRPRYSPTSFAILREAGRSSREYVEHALNVAAYYHEYRHVWDVFTTAHCLHRGLEVLRLNREYANLIMSLAQEGSLLRLPLLSRSETKIQVHVEKARRQALSEIVSNGFSRSENPALLNRLLSNPQGFLPDAAVPIVEQYVLGARAVLETLGQLWGVSALAFDPELTNTIMRRIWWADETLPESWPYVLILSRFRDQLRRIGEKVEYGGTIAVLDLALQSGSDHPGARLLRIFNTVRNAHSELPSDPIQFQEYLCENLGWDPPLAVLSKLLVGLEKEIRQTSGSIGSIFLADAAEFVRVRLARPDIVFKPSAWEEAMVLPNMRRILIEMPSFYLEGKTHVLYAGPSNRTKAYLEYAMLNQIRSQSYETRRISCPWAEKRHLTNAYPYDCDRKTRRGCSISSKTKEGTKCLFFEVCHYLGLYSPPVAT